MPADELIKTSQREPLATRSGGVTDISVSGMTCGNCARHVTEAIQAVSGVRSATVSLDAHSARIRWAADAEPNLSAVVKAIKDQGYGAELAESPAHAHDEGVLAGWKLNVYLGVPVTLLLMVGEWALALGMARWFQWLSFALAGAVQVLAGARFYRGAWSQLKVGDSNMDTLVALGSTTAFAYSTWALFTSQAGHLYFMEAAAIITLISLGHWLEARVSARASSAVRDLLNLAPALARRRAPNGVESEVPVSELVPGDLAVLRPGARVPTDGQVVEGRSAVDESMLTGESLPIDKTPGAELFVGTVNLDGHLVMRVTATGEETALAQIIASVQRAQTSRARIQRIGDRVSSVFVPLVIVIAVGTALWWGLAPESARLAHERLAPFLWAAHAPQGAAAAAFIIAAAVLIVACPCAMGLATPAAIMAGSNAAARRGILIRDAVALEKAGNITSVVFDKTGTLTAGRPSVVKTWVKVDAGSPILGVAASLARRSGHPISKAIATVSNSAVEVDEWKEIHGAGVQAQVRASVLEPGNPADARSLCVRLGSLPWFRELKLDLGGRKDFVEEWTAQGSSVVAFAVEESVVAVFAVKDTLKPGVVEVVKDLARQNLQVYLVTGDNARTAAAIAKQAGIGADRVLAEIRPGQKADFVRALQQQGKRVAFIGDGINDAPALEQADLGIAVSRATDIAREAADIILLNSEIQAVPESLGLARASLRTIKQNLFWAFFYNAAGIPLAALGFMSPVLCAAAMGLSDLIVLGNALRLMRWRLRR